MAHEFLALLETILFDKNWKNLISMYRTTVEMEPHTGEIYTVQQGPGGGVRMAKSSRVRDDMIQHRRPTHISEARYMF